MQLFRKSKQQTASLGDAENVKFAHIPDADIDTHKYAYVPKLDEGKFLSQHVGDKYREPTRSNTVINDGGDDDDEDDLYAEPSMGTSQSNKLVRSNTIGTTTSTTTTQGKDKIISLPGPYTRYRILRPNLLSSLRVIVEDFDPEKHVAALSLESQAEKMKPPPAASPPASPSFSTFYEPKKSERKTTTITSSSEKKKKSSDEHSRDEVVVPHLPEEAFRCEFNAFHPRKYPLVLKSPERHTLGVARFKPFNVTGVQAEICLGGDTRSGARFETVGFERRSSRGGSEPGKGWRWLRGPPVEGLKQHWKSGSMKLEDEFGQLVAVMLRDTAKNSFVGGFIDNREEGVLFIRLDVRGEDLDWVVLSTLAVHQAWKRTRRDTAGSFASGAGRGATMVT